MEYNKNESTKFVQTRRERIGCRPINPMSKGRRFKENRRSLNPYGRALLAYLGATCVLLIVGALLAAWVLQASTELAAVDTDAPRFVLDGTVVDEDMKPAFTSDDDLLIPVSFLQEYSDAPVYVEQDRDGDAHVIWPIHDLLFETRVGDEYAWVNDEPTDLAAPTYELDDGVYICADFAELMGMVFEHHADTNRVTVKRSGDPVTVARVRRMSPPENTAWESVSSVVERVTRYWADEDSVPMRTEPSERAPILFRLSPGESVAIRREVSGWYEVSYKGVSGYIPATATESIESKTVRAPKYNARAIEEESLPPMTGQWEKDTATPPGELISLVWEQVTHRTPDPESIDPVPQVSVISPTWFHLLNEDGQMSNLADSEYVDWAHSEDIKVWGLASNSFDPELTSEVLNDREARRNVIRQLLHYARIYELDGINVDFENMYQEDKDRFSQFVHELSALARPMGLTISVDVTTLSTSPTWSLCYDRAELARAADYIILMAYDQHTAGSSEAGSVATLPWTERGLRGVLEEVPAEQLILGVPFYMRIWEETAGEDGQPADVSSRAVGMSWAQNNLGDKQDDIEWDEATGQHYVEYEGDAENTTYRIWIEDEYSLRARLSLVHKYDLAGVAGWRRGLETPEVWDIIDKSMRKGP